MAADPHPGDAGQEGPDPGSAPPGEPDGTVVDDPLAGLPMPLLATADALALLAGGTLTPVGRLLASSNNAFVCTVEGPGADGAPLAATCVWKPVLGERPLADFPDGTLGRREVAAFLASEAMGWGIVPPTVLRDGPFGEGMAQLWIAADPAADPVAMVVDADPRLRRVAVFDAAVNNTDRKAGHLLPVPGGHVYGVDHGVTFSPVPKLRTVLWAWRGEPFADGERAALERLRDALADGLGEDLRGLLSRLEVRATARRVEALLAAGRFPGPVPGWPAFPYPPV